MSKAALRLEFALHREEKLRLSEHDYAMMLLHQLWDIESQARRFKMFRCAAAIALARQEIMTIFPNTQPQNEQGAALQNAPGFLSKTKTI